MESGARYWGTMALDNVNVVRGMWAAFLRDDFESALSAFAPDVEWDGTDLPDGSVSRGHDAVLDHVSKWADMWDSWEVELEEVINADQDRVIAFVRERARTKTGLEVDERHSELYAVRNGKIVYRKGFSDADEALREAGMNSRDG